MVVKTLPRIGFQESDGCVKAKVMYTLIRETFYK